MAVVCVHAQPAPVADSGFAIPSGGEVKVRFRLEAAGDGRKAALAGSFNSWKPEAGAMELQGDVYETVVKLPPGDHQYKFVLDDAKWIKDPANPSVTDDGYGAENSIVRVTSDGQVLFPSPAELALPPSLRAEPAGEGKSRVSFAYRSPDAKQVSLAGSFNHWSPTSTPMVKKGDVFTTTVVLEDGEHFYKFVVNGTEWRSDPLNPEGADDNNSGKNSVVRVGSAADMRKSSESTADGRINQAALLHKPGSIEYFNPLGDGTAVVKVRTRASDVTSVSVNAGTAGEQGLRSEYRDERFETFSGRIPVAEHKGAVQSAYVFELMDRSGEGTDPVRVGFGAEGSTTSPNQVTPFRAERTKEEIFLTPVWARKVVWYEIFPERFRNGSKANDPKTTALREWTSDWFRRAPDETGPAMEPGVFGRRYGGDLQGVMEKLPYLKQLGVGAIWFNPVFEAESLHKYDATDYRHVDDNFGFAGEYEKTVAGEDLLDETTWKWSESDKLFLELIRKAHDAGIKVIVDGVFNHTGTAHPAFQDLKQRRQESRYSDWYNVTSWEPFTYEGWGGYDGLPVFKEDEHGFVADTLRQHLNSVTRRWMDPNGDGNPSDGIDGWRLDVPNEVSSEWWQEWRRLVKSINPDAIIIGEIWDPPAKWLRGDQFDSVMNYQMAQALLKFFGNGGKATDLKQELEKLLHSVPVQSSEVMLNLMNSHDTDRFVSMLFNPGRGYDTRNRQQDLKPGEYNSGKPPVEVYDRMKQVAAVQFGYVGAPMIYYGDETGMWGADDPEDRKPMIWEDLEPYEKPDENHFMADVHARFQRLAAIRNSLPALQTGDFEVVLADDDARLFGFRRSAENETVLVVSNDSEKVQEVTLPVRDTDPVEYVDMIHDPQVKVVGEEAGNEFPARVQVGEGAKLLKAKNGILRLRLEPRTTWILAGKAR